MDITQIDKNFENRYSYEGMTTYDIEQPPFRLFGLSREPGETDYKRMPYKVLEAITNDSIHRLSLYTAGIRLRFKTDSKRIVLTCELPALTKFDHMPRTGVACFDLYADGRYCNVFRSGVNEGTTPGREEGDCGYSSGYEFPDSRQRELLIHFPLYNRVSKVYISLEEGSSLAPCDDYKIAKPIVYYGSSITQGGCASHPGNCYTAILSRRLDADHINLGFSGNARGELAMAEYIGSLSMHAFVYDYDYNAPTVEHLQNTHEPFFKRFREYQPTTPVIMVSAANIMYNSEEITGQRREIIRTTYENAVAAGDKNVYFIDGSEIYKEVGLDYCTVDCVHPNDLGFLCMANTIGAVLENM